jgi:enoyl-CoA hydratase/carnithine racemase
MSADGRSGPTGPTELVVETVAPGVRQIRLDRVDRLNALGVETAKDLEQAVLEIGGDPTVRVLMLTGTGRAFCVGADLKQRATMSHAQRYAHNRLLNQAFDAVAAISVPTLAVVNGLALGGGCELALACDLRIAADDAVFGLPETKVGAFPGAGGTQRLTRLIGAANAMAMMYTGRRVDALESQRLGLVQWSAPSAELASRARAYALEIASSSPTSTAAVKRLVHAGRELPLEAALGLEAQELAKVFGSQDYEEGLAAFKERRAPTFQDRTIDR